MHSTFDGIDQEQHALVYDGLFESVPISVRVEDFSEVKDRLDRLAVEDVDALKRYLADNPDFVHECAKLIRVVDVNTAALELHGYADKKEFINSVTRSFTGPNIRAVEGGLIAVFERRTRIEFETVIVNKIDCRERRLLVRWTVPPGFEETYARTLLTSIDVTDVYRSNERLQQFQKMEIMGRLTSGIAHDLNNVFTVIQGNADLLRLDVPANEQLEDLILAVNRGTEMTRRLLAFARKQALDPIPVDISGRVAEAVRFASPSLSPQCVVEANIHEDTWNVFVDPGPLEGALLNVILNANDAMPDGGVISVSARNVSVEEDSPEKLAQGDYVRIDVTDSGTGMAEAVRERVFEPFYTTKMGQGSGLGLSMVYGFCTQSGGTVKIASTPESGTTVSMFLPRVRSVPKEEKHRVAVAGGKNVLLVEDESRVRNMVTEVLTRLGYAGVAVTNGDDAIDLLEKENDFDLVVTDVQLPGTLNGWALLDKIREQSQIPVLVVSGCSRAAPSPLPNGAAFLPKPFGINELIRAIEQVAQEKSAAPQYAA